MAERLFTRNICSIFIFLPHAFKGARYNMHSDGGCVRPQLNKFYPPPPPTTSLFLLVKKIVSSFLYEHFDE